MFGVCNVSRVLKTRRRFAELSWRRFRYRDHKIGAAASTAVDGPSTDQRLASDDVERLCDGDAVSRGASVGHGVHDRIDGMARRLLHGITIKSGSLAG